MATSKTKKAARPKKAPPKKAAPKKAAPKKASSKKAAPKKAAPKKAAAKKAAPKKAAPRKPAPKRAAPAAKKKPAPKKKPQPKPASTATAPSKPKPRATPLVFALPPDALTIEDIRIEQQILRNAPRDLEIIPVDDGVTSVFRAQLGAALFRRGDPAGAADTWAGIPDTDNLANVVRPWRALALARTGDLQGALDLAPADDHLAGEILCALGRTEEGLAVIAKDREDAEEIEWRLLRQAFWLRRAGQPKKAATLIEKRMEKIARFGLRLHTEALRAWLDAGDTEAAARQFDSIESLSPGFARTLLGKSLDDLDWLPHGLASLAREASERGVGIHFLDAATSKDLTSGLETGPTAPMGVLPGPKMWQALGEGKEYVVVAESIGRPSRTAYDGGSVPRWLAHPDRPGKLYLAMSPRIPAFLWHPVDANVDAIAAELATVREQLAVDEPRSGDLPRTLRLFIGGAAVPSPYTGELEELGFHTFARVAVSSPFLEAYGWGGEHFEDPHDYFVDRGRLDGAMAMRENGGQAADRPLMESYRTEHSRSIFTLEQHRSGFLVELRYRPSQHPERIRAFNERFGTTYPEDLPLDGAGLLMHFHDALGAEELMASVGPDLPADERWRIYAVGALLHGTVLLDDWLRQLPEPLKRNGDDVAYFYNHLPVLMERALERTDLHGALQSGPWQSAMRPPESDDDEDEDDEEDEDGDEEES